MNPIPYNQAVKLFPKEDIIEIHDDIIAELKKELLWQNRNLESVRLDSTVCADEYDWIFELTQNVINDRISQIRAKIRKFEARNAHLRGDTPLVKQYDLEAIKQVPIEQIMPSKPVYKSRHRSKYNCPLHNEKTASFTVYEETNTYYCFGCGSGGDVVDLYMKLNDCDFITALKYLSGI